MTIMTVTAHYRLPPDEVFALALSFDAFHTYLGGLIDYHGMPRGTVTEGQSYSCTPVLWTLLRVPEVHVTCTRIDPVARICESTVIDDLNTTQSSIHITPDRTGSLWTERLEISGPPPGRFARFIGKYTHKASHRRMRGRNVRIEIAPS